MRSQSLTFLETLVNTPSPVGHETRGLRVWMDYAGTYADKRIMLGRFSVETTNLSTTDVLTLQFKGNVTMRVDGLTAGAGTVIQPSFNQTFTYGFVPAPGAVALLALAGLVGSRRR